MNNSSNSTNDNLYIYDFLPGELAVVVEHNDDLDNEGLITELNSILESNISEIILAATFETANDTTTKFRSFVTVRLYDGTLNSDRDLQSSIMSVLNEMDRLYINPGAEPSAEDNDEDTEPPDITIVSITPNWSAAGNGPTSKTSGGPGGYPTIVGQSELKDFEFPNRFSQGVNISNLQLRLPCRRADVAVLDTIPSCKSGNLTDKSGNDYYTLDTSLSTPLLDNLMNGNALRIYPDPKIDTYQDLDTDDYVGPMPDHGLFVSGIIHMIAPETSPIHLIQVLNKNGVGTIPSLARGLKKAVKLTEASDNPLVINMSLTFNIPVPRSQTRTLRIFVPYLDTNLALLASELSKRGLIPDEELDKFGHNKIGVHTILSIDNDEVRQEFGDTITELTEKYGTVIKDYNTFMHNIQRRTCRFRYRRTRLHVEMARPLDHLLHTINSIVRNKGREVYLVAAAGNEGKGEDAVDRPRALYPAAFQNVIGVGALNKNYSEQAMANADATAHPNKQGYADFSSVADLPKADGIRTLGEDIVGAYISNEPGNNMTGVAKWSGTSFAAAIVSGTIALLLQHNISDPVGVIRGYKPDPSGIDDLGIKRG